MNLIGAKHKEYDHIENSKKLHTPKLHFKTPNILHTLGSPLVNTNLLPITLTPIPIYILLGLQPPTLTVFAQKIFSSSQLALP